jgi:methionyl-tRNA formyltransferase
LAQRDEPIGPDDDTGSLGARLATAGATLLVETLWRLDEIEPVPQADAGASLAPKLSPEERWIDWSDDAASIVRRVRAFAPRPGATTRLRTGSVNVLRAEVAADTEGVGSAPGTVATVDGLGFTVATGDGFVRPLEVGPSGRSHMTAAEFVRGRRLRPGERLG